MRVERFNYPVLSVVLLTLIGFGVGGANQTKAAAADTEQEQALLYSGFKVKFPNCHSAVFSGVKIDWNSAQPRTVDGCLID
jgi:hypothetical protein